MFLICRLSCYQLHHQFLKLSLPPGLYTSYCWKPGPNKEQVILTNHPTNTEFKYWLHHTTVCISDYLYERSSPWLPIEIHNEIMKLPVFPPHQFSADAKSVGGRDVAWVAWFAGLQNNWAAGKWVEDTWGDPTSGKKDPKACRQVWRQGVVRR